MIMNCAYDKERECNDECSALTIKRIQGITEKVWWCGRGKFPTCVDKKKVTVRE